MKGTKPAMKKIILIIHFALLLCCSKAQGWRPDSLKEALVQANNEIEKFSTLIRITVTYTFSKPDTAMMYAQQALTLAKKINTDAALSQALRTYAGVLSQTGNYPQAIYSELESLKIIEKSNDFSDIGWIYHYLAADYMNVADYEHAIFYAHKAKSLYESHPNLYLSRGGGRQYWDDMYETTLEDLIKIYTKLNQSDSALKYLQIINRRFPNDQSIFYFYGDIYFTKGDYVKALSFYQKDYHAFGGSITTYNALAKTFRKLNPIDSSIFYANKAFKLNTYAKYPKGLLETVDLLADVYQSKGNNDSAVKYLQLTMSIKDSLFNQRKIIQMQSMTFDEQLRQQDILEAQKAYRDRIKTYILIGGLIALLVIAFILFRNNRQKQKANKEIGKAYEELKSTQAQLIQSEKMASLGELTAGIAHEIQNPLNFVNNFSEVNDELINDINDENDIGEVKAIANDIKQNNEKILFHGKRADAIVKGMLQHSKQTKGVKEPTDINALCDEYLRLSYHGMRAKDKNFNAEIKTDFDEKIGKINVIPQDIGRVLLNLINNAFYAVGERCKVEGVGYVPMVTIVTKKLNNTIEIIICDNGNGIPQNIIDKIFQPFFTTKPTGEGTGLGLSLSYDIIKAHGGDIKIETKEGEGTTFIINLPVV